MTTENITKNLAEISLYERVGTEALHPELKGLAESLVTLMEKIGKPISITECFRTAKKQDEYYAQGRTSPGSTITNAKALESYHQFGLAFDVVFKTYGYNPPDGWWEDLGKEAEGLGLVWGGSFGDKPHIEYHPQITWNELKAYFESEEDEKDYLSSVLAGLTAVVKKLIHR